MLLLVATPIGNIQDISQRAIEALSSAEIIACEDTRHTGMLLAQLKIPKKKLISFYKENEQFKEEEILSFLREGKTVVLVSDAGMPCVSDPGSRLVDRCHKEQIRVSIIPGPTACMSAYALSGIVSHKPVQFIGFLPKTEKAVEEAIFQLRCYDGATIAYEAPHRLQSTLKIIAQIDPEWQIVVVRELTKYFEQVVRSSARALAEIFSEKVLGEIVLVFLPRDVSVRPSDEQIIEEVKLLREKWGCALSEAAQMVSRNHGLSHRTVYNACVGSSEN